MTPRREQRQALPQAEREAVANARSRYAAAMRTWGAAGVVGLALGIAAMGCGGDTTGGGGAGGATTGGTGGAITGGTGGAITGGTGGAVTGGAGGTGGDAGTGGGGGFVPLAPATKIDLLLMIDNSISMADKQQVLSDAVPQLVNRFVTPTIDPSTGKPQFKAVQDIHIGVISSSLGGHGGDQCRAGGPSFNPTQNDRAHLIGTVRTGLSSHQNLGFLWWDPNGVGGGQANQAQLVDDFRAHVKATGENGCGYESQLESWYRFLIEPQPYENIVLVDQQATPQGVDSALLQQRKDFLRPDSAVVIMMLTDENDCSVVDGGYNWISAQTSNPNNTPFLMPRATSACAANPDSPCCRSCAAAESTPPSGCQALAADAECLKNGGFYTDAEDHPMLRCWQQKRRFGIDFLYPTQRYVDALTKSSLCPTWDGKGPVACKPIPNPLLATRNPGLVFLAGVVGVPWQDLATKASLASASDLVYLSAAELAAEGRWDWLLAKGVNDQPDDPLMIESTTPRTGTQPSTGKALAPPSASAGAQPANGHEWNTSQQDLQYACSFRLPTPKDCNVALGGCDCDDVSTGYTANNPLCQNPATSQYSKLQHYAKAYPGARHLQVLKGIGKQAVVASICPRVTSGDPTSASYGYNPVVDVTLKTIAPVLAK